MLPKSEDGRAHHRIRLAPEVTSRRRFCKLMRRTERAARQEMASTSGEGQRPCLIVSPVMTAEFLVPVDRLPRRTPASIRSPVPCPIVSLASGILGVSCNVSLVD
jgi:hypothetical protein